MLQVSDIVSISATGLIFTHRAAELTEDIVRMIKKIPSTQSSYVVKELPPFLKVALTIATLPKLYATTYDAYQRLQTHSNQTSQEQLANLSIVAGGVLTSLSLATGAAMMFSKTPLLIGLNLALTVAGVLVDSTGCALNFSQNGLTSDSMFQLVSLLAFNGGRAERNLYRSLWHKKLVTRETEVKKPPEPEPPTALPPDLIRPRIESGKPLISFADVVRLGTERYDFKPVSIEINKRNYFVTLFEDWPPANATCFGIHRDVEGHFHGISFGFEKIGEENYTIFVKNEISTAGQIEVGEQNIYWLLMGNSQRVIARSSKGQEIPYIKRVEERAKLKKAVVDSRNADWQKIYQFFEFSDIVPLETLQQGYEFMSRVARSGFPYEVGVGITPINGHFVPCLELGNANAASFGNLGLTNVLLHNHSWTAGTSKVPSLGKALYRPSGMDLLCFEKEIKYVGKLIGVNGASQAYDPYVTSVLSNHGAIQLRYQPNPSGQAKLHALYTDTRNVSLHPSPRELIDIIWGEMNWTMEHLYPAKLTAEQVTPQEFYERTGIDVRFTGSMEVIPEPSTINPADLADKSMWLVAYQSIFGPPH